MPDVTVIQPTKEEQAALSSQTNPKRRVAGYARVSTEKDEQFSSYEAQIEYYTRLISANDAWEFVNVYTDEGLSGTSVKKRRGFQTMIRDALAGRIDLIITKSVSRFARNTVDSLMTIRKLKEHHIEIFFEKENIWTFDGKGELLITIMSSLAQEESRSISENVKWGMAESMRQGKAWVPYKVFLGYKKGPDGNMVIEPSQALLVRRIYGMYLSGMSPYRIAERFEKECIAFSEGKTRWHASTVYHILRNEKYKGDALRQKTYTKDYLTKEKAVNHGELPQYYIRNHHEPIISPALFDYVQKLIAVRGPAGNETNNDYLRNRVKCADCGRSYVPIIWAPHTPHARKMWRCCRKYHPGKETCQPPAVSEEILTAVYEHDLVAFLQDGRAVVSAVRQILSVRYPLDGLYLERSEWIREKTLVSAKILQECDPPEVFLDRLGIAEARLRLLCEIIRKQHRDRQYFIHQMAAVCRDPGLWLPCARSLFPLFVDHMTVLGSGEIRTVFLGA